MTNLKTFGASCKMKPQVLLIDLSGSSSHALVAAITQAGFDIPYTLNNIRGLMKYSNSYALDYIVVNCISPDLTLFKEINLAMRNSPRPLIMFTETSNKTLAQHATASGVSVYVVNGFNAKRIRHIMDLAAVRFSATQAIQAELRQLKNTINERKIIDKAKGILMKRRTIDENKAFHLIRKMAMDRNQKMAEVAENIIDVDTLLL